jgi:hypothetical protein
MKRFSKMGILIAAAMLPLTFVGCSAPLTLSASSNQMASTAEFQLDDISPPEYADSSYSTTFRTDTITVVQGDPPAASVALRPKRKMGTAARPGSVTR